VSPARLRPGPEPKYEAVLEVGERIWSCAEQLCGKRLAPALELGLPHYTRHLGPLLPSQKKLLRGVSASTLDRLLTRCKARAHPGQSGTRPGSLLRHQVPIAGEVWDERRLGFLEADRVAHCGGSLAGNFIWSLTYTDLACGQKPEGLLHNLFLPSMKLVQRWRVGSRWVRRHRPAQHPPLRRWGSQGKRAGMKA
jgi:hypothetical protein